MRKHRRSPTLHPVTRNGFAALEDECEDRKRDKLSLFSDKILVVGVSQVRYFDRAFCARDRKNRTLTCYLVEGIGDIGDRLGSVRAGESFRSTVCVSAGGNDIGRIRRQELFTRYRETLDRVRDLGGTPLCVVSCPAGLWEQDGGLKHL